MERVAVLPAPDEILPTNIIPLFGILPENHEEKECHFCFENVEKGELLTMTTECCKQSAHCKCVKTWAALSSLGTEETIQCAYCRTLFQHEEVCFLCLEKKKNDEEFIKTTCCQTTVHHKCIQDLQSALLPLPFEYVLECGQPIWCGCLWIAV